MSVPVLADTSVLAEIMKPGSPAAAWAAARTAQEPCYVSSISVFEVIFGFQQAALGLCGGRRRKMRLHGAGAAISSRNFSGAIAS